MLSLAKEPDVPQLSQLSAEVAPAGDMPPTKKMKVSPFDWFQCAPADSTDITSASVTRPSEPLNDRVLSEIRQYETEPLPCQSLTDVFDPLPWWGEHASTYPVLSDVARRLLVIPASSAECERHFSAFNARHIISSQRNMLFPETVEALSIVLEGYKNKLIR